MKVAPSVLAISIFIFLRQMDRVVLLRTLPIGFVNRTRNHPFRGSKTSTTRSKSEVESVYNEYCSIRVIYIDLCPTNTGGQGRVIALVGGQAALCIERRPFIGANPQRQQQDVLVKVLLLLYCPKLVAPT
jgi:hypothetical protein